MQSPVTCNLINSNKAVKTRHFQGFHNKRPVCSRPSTPKTKLKETTEYETKQQETVRTGPGGHDCSDLCGAYHGIRAHQLWPGPVQNRGGPLYTAVFTPAAVPGLFAGCLLSNLLCGAMPLDVVFGSLATLIGAAGSWYLRKHKWCVCIPPILANTIIIPWVLRYAYGSEDMILLAMVTVGIGEILAIGILGNTLLIALERYKNLVFRQQAA